VNPANASVARHGVRVGIDIGGTFTDLVLCHPDGRLVASKVSTTPHDPALAVVQGLAALLSAARVAAADVLEIVHGTTVASNAILQKKGAIAGVLTTRGFRDVLEIGRIRTPGMFDLAWRKPEPLVPRRRRLEVEERIGADGSIVQALDRDGVLAAGRSFCDAGVETVAICFINSYANAAHEQQAERLMREHYPALTVTSSWSVLPELKEYERVSTTVVNAYILPVMRSYLSRLSSELHTLGVTAPVLVMASNGGMMGVRAASAKPVFAVASGPAGGVTGAARLGAISGFPDLIVFDMGGTTAKAAIVERGQPMLTSEYEFREGISSPSRFIKGGGYVLKVPAIDIAEVGSGGGSLASIDAGGLLRVGPESAGADPGPACYGRGNDRPTVTDANVVLGFLNPRALAGGTLRIDRKLSEDAVRRHVAEPLGISVEDAARGIRDIANVAMARAIRAVTVERGRDPRDMTLMAFGGSGPAHATDVANLLGIKHIVVPPMSGVFSALGMLASDVEHNFVRTVLRSLERVTAADLDEMRESLATHGAAALADEGYARDEIEFSFVADLRYAGQSSDLPMPLEAGALDQPARARLAAEFERAYEATYGYATGEPLELVNLRLAVRGTGARLDFAAIRPPSEPGERQMRHVSFARGAASVETPVLPRSAMTADLLNGPAILESYDTTIVVSPGARARNDAFGNLIVELD
jgi:N-methylhydantoinase A